MVRLSFHRKNGAAFGGDWLDVFGEKIAQQTTMNWKNRGDRIARMHEQDQFNRFFMPLTYGVSLIGLLVLGWVGLLRMEG